MALTFGYRRSIPYHLGIGSGFFLLMIASALVASAIKTLLPSLIPYLTVLGSLYIVYLAVHMLRSSFSLASKMPKPLGFGRGMLLQLFKPKGLLMGLTIYSTFLVDVPSTIVWRGGSALFLALLCISAPLYAVDDDPTEVLVVETIVGARHGLKLVAPGTNTPNSIGGFDGITANTEKFSVNR